MRFQFSMRSILLATAFIAVICGTLVAYRYMYVRQNYWEPRLPFQLVLSAPLWIPFVFVAYAIGRRTFTARFVATFAVIELAAIFLKWATSDWINALTNY